MGGVRVKSVQLAAVAGRMTCDVPVQQISLLVVPPDSTKYEVPAPPVTALSFLFSVTRVHSNGHGGALATAGRFSSGVWLSTRLAQAGLGSPAAHNVGAVGLYSRQISPSFSQGVKIPGRETYRMLLGEPGNAVGASAIRSPLPSLPV